MSVGHSEAFELGVHCRKQLPPAASDGIAAQNVSAYPGWSAQNWVHAIVHTPGWPTVAPTHVVPEVQSVPAVQ